jgi:hypothetical protein
VIRRTGSWKGIDDVEYETLEWVDWFNHRRLLEPIGHVPPSEFEAAYWRKEGSRAQESNNGTPSNWGKTTASGEPGAVQVA